MNVTTPLSAELDLSTTAFLVVDDKPHFREIAHNALMRCKARDVKYAPDVDEAIQVLKRFGGQIGGVICDWDLSPVSGLQLLQSIRAGKYPKIPRDLCVVILTSKPDAPAVKAAMALDVNGFAIAPLSVEKFVKNLTQAIQRVYKLRDPAQYAAVNVPAPEKAPEKTSGGAPVGVMLTPQKRPTASAQEPAGSVKPSDLVNVRMCTLSQVKAGGILARDLNDRDGHLLLKAGAALSQSLLDRLTDVSGGHGEAYHVWVGERRPA